ncbi:MAG: 23S rRNA (uracil(1939)-C(5))-methyltransferase RlmD [Lachnospiraceae bacterium]|nr:23S rRNA (uracil(1939)-C(5))-methyltransferase RlmD [Lachnospiraceae bacterium]
MKKGQIIEGIVERVDFPNKGIVKTEEGLVTVKNALPGQTISLGISKVRNGRAEGRLLEVLKKSPCETGEVCNHFGVCGGCTYLSFNYEDELKIKEEQVRKLVSEGASAQDDEWKFEGIKKSPALYGYRNKMEFSFGDEFKDGPLSLGMHKRNSFYDVVTVDTCKIVDEDYRLILSATLDFFKKRNVPYYHRLKHEGVLRHLLVRKGHATGEILVGLVTSTQDLSVTAEGCKTMEEYRDTLLSLPIKGSFAGILQIDNDNVADTVTPEAIHVLHGHDYFYEELLGLKFKVSTFSFFQTNSAGAEVLYDTVREYVGDGIKAGGTVFDLYSGTGTIAQLMAKVSGKVIGVEIVEEAVEAAKANAALNNLDNCEFIAGDVLKVLDDIEDKPDYIILDPPRDGIHPKAIGKIINYRVPNIVYVSCKPTSLKRDLEIFIENGYRLVKAVAVDQFPWTSGVETVCLLSKLHEAKHHVHISVDMKMQ